MKTFRIVGGDIQLNTGNNNSEEDALLRSRPTSLIPSYCWQRLKYLSNTKELHYCVSMATIISQLVPWPQCFRRQNFTTNRPLKVKWYEAVRTTMEYFFLLLHTPLHYVILHAWMYHYIMYIQLVPVLNFCTWLYEHCFAHSDLLQLFKVNGVCELYKLF